MFINWAKNKRGSTFIEIITTTAIIGSLVAISVPNFLRIKMNTNMELVKQHLRVLGHEVNEYYIQSNPNEYPEDILNLEESSDEELSITASLNSIARLIKAIRNKGYINLTYIKGVSLKACPGNGLIGIVGDRCFLLTFNPPRISDELTDVEITTHDMGATPSISFFESLLGEDSTLTDDEKIKLLIGFFEILAYGINWYFDGAAIYDSSMEGKIPSSILEMFAQNKTEFDRLLPQVSEKLKNKGIELYMTGYEESSRSGYFYNKSNRPDNYYFENEKIGGVTVGVKLDHKTNNPYPHDSEEAKALELFWTDRGSLGNFS